MVIGLVEVPRDGSVSFLLRTGPALKIDHWKVYLSMTILNVHDRNLRIRIRISWINGWTSSDIICLIQSASWFSNRSLSSWCSMSPVSVFILFSHCSVIFVVSIHLLQIAEKMKCVLVLYDSYSMTQDKNFDSLTQFWF